MTAPTTEAKTYLARNPCGCICGAVVDAPEHKRDTAREIAAWLRLGCTIETVETAWVRSGECSFAACADNPDCVRAPKERRVRARRPSHQAVLL